MIYYNLTHFLNIIKVLEPIVSDDNKGQRKPLEEPPR